MPAAGEGGGAVKVTPGRGGKRQVLARQVPARQDQRLAVASAGVAGKGEVISRHPRQTGVGDAAQLPPQMRAEAPGAASCQPQRQRCVAIAPPQIAQLPSVRGNLPRHAIDAAGHIAAKRQPGRQRGSRQHDVAGRQMRAGQHQSGGAARSRQPGVEPGVAGNDARGGKAERQAPASLRASPGARPGVRSCAAYRANRGAMGRGAIDAGGGIGPAAGRHAGLRGERGKGAVE